jgi:hypothetical protein
MFRAWISYVVALECCDDLASTTSDENKKDFFKRLWEDANESVGFSPSKKATYWKSIFERHADSQLQDLKDLVPLAGEGTYDRVRAAISLFSVPASAQIKEWFDQYQVEWYAL